MTTPLQTILSQSGSSIWVLFAVLVSSSAVFVYLSNGDLPKVPLVGFEVANPAKRKQQYSFGARGMVGAGYAKVC